MKRPNLILIACFILVLFFATGCIFLPKELTDEDKYVRIYQRDTLIPHGTDIRYLEVCGKTYSHLYSFEYCFVQEWNSILFVTQRADLYKLHLFDLKNKHDTVIKTENSIGAEMGRPRTAYYTCFVEKVDGETAMLVEHYYLAEATQRVYKYQINRAQKTITLLTNQIENREH